MIEWWEWHKVFFFSSSVSSSWQNKSILEICQKQSQDLFDGVKMYIYERCEEERDEIWALKKGGEPYLIKNNHIKSAGQNFCEHKEISSRMLRNNVYRNWIKAVKTHRNYVFFSGKRKTTLAQSVYFCISETSSVCLSVNTVSPVKTNVGNFLKLYKSDQDHHCCWWGVCDTTTICPTVLRQ